MTLFDIIMSYYFFFKDPLGYLLGCCIIVGIIYVVYNVNATKKYKKQNVQKYQEHKTIIQNQYYQNEYYQNTYYLTTHLNYQQVINNQGTMGEYLIFKTLQ